jgi:hypothetical protein
MPCRPLACYGATVFNDCFRMFEHGDVSPPVSFFRMVRIC